MKPFKTMILFMTIMVNIVFASDSPVEASESKETKIPYKTLYDLIINRQEKLVQLYKTIPNTQMESDTELLIEELEQFSEKLTIFIQKKDELISVKVSEKGVVDFPINKKLAKENAIVLLNRPKGTTKLHVIASHKYPEFKNLDTETFHGKKYTDITSIFNTFHALTKFKMDLAKEDIGVGYPENFKHHEVWRWSTSYQNKPVNTEILIIDGPTSKLYKTVDGVANFSFKHLSPTAKFLLHYPSKTPKYTYVNVDSKKFILDFLKSKKHAKSDIETFFEHMKHHSKYSKNLDLVQKGMETLSQKKLEYHDEKRLSFLGYHMIHSFPNKKNIEQGLKHLKKASDLGDSRANYELGRLFINDKFGVEKNVDLAIAYYKQAADQGEASALYFLGSEYYTGNYLNVNDFKAHKYLKASAEKNYLPACGLLGVLYLKGSLGQKNLRKGKELILKVAENGYRSYQFYLGSFYQMGSYGFEKNYEKAHKWYSLAADRGCEKAKYKLNFLEILMVE